MNCKWAWVMLALVGIDLDPAKNLLLSVKGVVS